MNNSFLGHWVHRAITLFLTLLCLSTMVRADYAEQSYSAASAPGVSSKSLGFDFLSGTINYSQSDVVGVLPYTRMYQGSVRSSMRFSMNFYDKLITTAGWTDNYDNFLDFQDISANERLYRIRLPGELHATYFVWNSTTNTWKRMYSSNPEETMIGVTGILTKSDLGEYSITKSAEVLTIKKYGVTYVTTASPYLSGTAKYLRVASVNSPSTGKTLTLSYDAALNMTKVQDNRGSTLTFTRAFKENAAATTQTANEKTVITAVTYSGASGAQTVSYTYQAAWNKNAVLNDDVVYKLISATSTVGGTRSFVYEQLMAPWTNLYLRQNGANCFAEPCLSYIKVPILRSVQNADLAFQSHVLVTQSYSYNSSTSGFNTATVSVRSYAPIGNSAVGDMAVRYDDMQGKVFLDSYQPSGVMFLTGSTSISIAKTQKTVDGFSYLDDSQVTLSYTSPTNFAAFTVGNQPISSMVNDSYYSHLVSYTTLGGAKVELSYDPLNRITQSKETAIATNVSRTTTYTYGALSNGAVNPYNVPTRIVTPYQTITNVVNANGQITQQTQTSSQAGSTPKVITYSYNTTTGLLSAVDGPLTGTVDRVTFAYDSYGNKTSESQVVNGITRTTQYLGYNSFAKPERIVHPNGLVDQFIYNADGTLQRKVHGVGGTTGNISGQTISYTYDALKRVKTETNPDGEVTSSDYDTLGRVVKISHPNGSATHKTYHPNGAVNAEETKDAAGVLFIASYQELDSNGRVAKVRSGSNADWYWESYGYDVSDNKVQAISRLGTVETWTYDAFNRVTSHTDGAGNTSTKSYDLQDNVTSAKDALNSGSSPLVYANGNLLKQEVNADFSTKTYSHDGADRVTQIAHHVRQCSYGNLDVLGRPASHTCVQNNAAAINGTYVHDYAYTYDATRFGRLESANSVGNSYGTDTSYTYDAYDRVIGKTQTVKAITTWGGTQPTRSVSYGYSTGGKLTSMTLPSGRIVNYNYDLATTKRGQMTSVAVNGSNLINSIAYNGAGQTLSWTWGNGSTYGIVYDTFKNGNIKTITNSTSANVQNYKADYGFDRDGRIVSITGLGTRDDYTYDRVNRLLTENRTNLSTNAAIFGITYTYDQNGNRKTLRGTGTHQQPKAKVDYTYAANTNRLATITRGGIVTSPAHLTEGELRLDFVSGYDSHGQRRWSGKRNGDTTQPEYYFAYNHKRERTVRSISNNGASWSANAIQYVYDEASHLIGEYTASGAPIVEYVWKGDVPIAALYGPTSATKIYYIITDAQNTPRRLIDTNNVVGWAWDSTAFGVAQPSVTKVNFNLRFPGQYYDAITKQHYNLNRYYNPEIGRYMEADPIGLEGGLNPYAYAGSNPVMNTDPSGLVYDFATGMYFPDISFEPRMNFDLGRNTSASLNPPSFDLFGALFPRTMSNFAREPSYASALNQSANLRQITTVGVGVSATPYLGAILGTSSVGTYRAVAGGTASEYTTVTSWAQQGVKPDLNPGRWVMTGEATRTNYVLTGLWGPKVPKYDVPFSNSITGSVPTSQVAWPSGLNFFRGVFGQRQLKGD